MKVISRKNFVKNRNEFILNCCRDKKVLHIGACDAPFTKIKFYNNSLLFKQINDVAMNQLGIDIDVEGIKIMKELGFSNVIFADMNIDTSFDFEPDIIIFGETIEHIMNLESAFNSLKKLMGANTELLISTPNFITFSKLFHAFFGKEFMHPDHNLVFTPRALEQLLGKVELDITQKIVTFLPNHLSNFWGKLDFIFARLFPMFSSTLLFSVKKK